MTLPLRTALLFAAATLALASLAPPARADASATLRDSTGKEVGRVTLRETPHGVLVRAELDGIPAGVHAIHIHEKGRCEGDFATAGGHFSPDGRAHGFLASTGPHAGDLPNVHVPASGKLVVEMRSPALELADGELLDADGASVVVHAGADDYETDPAGGAGERIACGVLTR